MTLLLIVFRMHAVLTLMAHIPLAPQKQRKR
jgi:hypothetical protein